MTCKVMCRNGHTRNLDDTDAEQFIRDGKFECVECGNGIEYDLSESLDLLCRICSDIYSVSSLREAQYTILEDCPACNARGFHDDSLHLAESWYRYKQEYDWMMSGKDGHELSKPNRNDLWDGLVHFCSAEELASIVQAGELRASNTGYFGVPAVCFTEAPPGNWDEIANRQGGFGIVFRRPDIIRKQGGPAVYMREEVLSDQAKVGFAESLKPFVNLVREASGARPRHDFLHEREWRTPVSIRLDDTEPFALIRGEFSRKTPGWKYIWQALIRYEELV